MPSDVASKNEGNGGRKPGSDYITVLKTENYCAALLHNMEVYWSHLHSTLHAQYKGEFNIPKSQGLTLWQYIMKEQRITAAEDMVFLREEQISSQKDMKEYCIQV